MSLRMGDLLGYEYCVKRSEERVRKLSCDDVIFENAREECKQSRCGQQREFQKLCHNNEPNHKRRIKSLD